jgi:hypothetical protein
MSLWMCIFAKDSINPENPAKLKCYENSINLSDT